MKGGKAFKSRELNNRYISIGSRDIGEVEEYKRAVEPSTLYGLKSSWS